MEFGQNQIRSVEMVVEVQENGIIRNKLGRLIGRLVDSVRFDSEHVELLNEPTEKDLQSPVFNVIWQAIKKWDIERKEGDGRAGATGTDVKMILNEIKPFLQENFQ